ncbi:MAG: PqqD family protein [candidate division KSB1 bacterium]|nr:PqqD family protein [candidate division KSB1 bacterium]
MKKKRDLHNENLLDIIPQRVVAHEETGEGLIVILKPKFSNKFLAGLFIGRMKRPYYKINLDDYGSFVWKCCDGKNTVARIGELLRQKFKKDIEPVYERLGMFIRTLESNHFITYSQTKE